MAGVFLAFSIYSVSFDLPIRNFSNIDPLLLLLNCKIKHSYDCIVAFNFFYAALCVNRWSFGLISQSRTCLCAQRRCLPTDIRHRIKSIVANYSICEYMRPLKAHFFEQAGPINKMLTNWRSKERKITVAFCWSSIRSAKYATDESKTIASAIYQTGKYGCISCL